MGLYVVEKMYKDKVKYDVYCLKMLNRRAKGKITNCDVLSRGKGPITLKEVIEACPKRTGDGRTTIYTQIRKILDALHKTKAELELDFNKPLGEQDPILKLNLLAKKKRKNAGTVLNEPSLDIFFKLHQVPGQDNLASTFSSLLVAEVDKRNLNRNKQMRLIEQLSYNCLKIKTTERVSTVKGSIKTEEKIKTAYEICYGPKTSKNVSKDTSNKVRKYLDAPMVEKLVSDDKLENKTIFPTIAKIEFVRPKQQEKPVRKLVKYAEMYRSQGPKGN
ncbi:hypothetical protein Tco_1023642 [Tanacetum coccineum]